METRVKKTSNTKTLLIEAAAELFMRQSYGAVSVDDIAIAAGIKKGTFYHHFSSKADLALAAYEHMWEDGKKVLDACFSPTVPAEKRLEKYTEAMYQCHVEDFEIEGKIYGCPLCSAGAEMSAQDDRIRQRLKDIYDGHCAYYASVLRDLPQLDGISRAEIEKLSREMFSYTGGVLNNAKVANDPEVIRRDLLPGLSRFLIPQPSGRKKAKA